MKFSPQIKYIANTSNYQTDYSASQKATSTVITTDSQVKQSKDYQKVVSLLNKLIESGITRMGEGYCISVSDIIYNILTQNGIKCHLAEVKLSIVDQKTKMSDMVGFETTFTQNSHKKVSTHVVVITDTEIPLLIDGSIAHKLPRNMQMVVEKAQNLGNKTMCNFQFADFGFLYQEKADGIGIPQLHQISILDRVNTDNKIFKSIHDLKRLNYIGIGLSIFAMINVLGKMFNIF
jgi:hypothetical protein